MLNRLNRLRPDHLYRLQLDRFSRVAVEHEEGFTLIELLVVIIIIGILAAIAIPVFLNQRQKGYDAGIKADLRNAATSEETYLTDYGSYTKTQSALSVEGFKSSSTTDYNGASNTLTVKIDGNKGYCISAQSASGKWFLYDSQNGGLSSQSYASTPSCSDASAA
jgi:type IV pilus assembly protein PilA